MMLSSEGDLLFYFGRHLPLSGLQIAPSPPPSMPPIKLPHLTHLFVVGSVTTHNSGGYFRLPHRNRIFFFFWRGQPKQWTHEIPDTASASALNSWLAVGSVIGSANKVSPISAEEQVGDENGSGRPSGGLARDAASRPWCP